MNHTAYNISPGFIQELYSRISDTSKGISPHPALSSSLIGGTIPSLDNIAKLINIVHWASFATEEGFPVSISLLFHQLSQSPDTFHFDAPLDFTVETLVKLGPALENPKADIGVWHDDTGQLKIWGFTTVSFETTINPDLWIKSLGPGQVLVSYRGRAIAALSANRAVFIDPRHFLDSLMPKIFAQAKKTDITLISLFRYNAILKIAEQMRLHNRGGTVLIVPEGDAWRKSIISPVKYTGGTNFLDAEAMIATPSRDHLADSAQLLQVLKNMNVDLRKDWLSNWQQAQTQCTRIARLTSVDGALVMTVDRFVYCFGAKIRSVDPTTMNAELSIIEPFENSTHERQSIYKLSGTRHLSAAQFTFDQPDSIAIVASQDGNITFFTRQNGSNKIITVQQAETALLHGGLGSLLWNLSFFSETGWMERGADKNEKGYLSGIMRWLQNTLKK